MSNRLDLIQNHLRHIQKKVWQRFKGYYLTGGTALSFHFNHRFSEDMDFFTQDYDSRTPDEIMGYLSKEMGWSFQLKAENLDERFVRMKVFIMKLPGNYPLKMDFVHDYLPNRHPPKKGIHSLDDIYFRKCSIAIGLSGKTDILGRDIPGGRQTAKDIFDLYCLSKRYQKLSQFCFGHFSSEQLERMCVWYRRFDRMDLKVGLQDLITKEDLTDVIPHLDHEILKNLVRKISW